MSSKVANFWGQAPKVGGAEKHLFWRFFAQFSSSFLLFHGQFVFDTFDTFLESVVNLKSAFDKLSSEQQDKKSEFDFFLLSEMV